MRMRVLGASLFIAIIGVAGSEPASAQTDEIFSDGFDGPKWYIDADGDGYGNPAVFVHFPTQPAGYVANALDCNDADAATHPGASDDPDAAFTDSNCDGIDGDIAKAIFVATTGVDGATCGTMANPCQTPAYAIGRLDAQHTQVYLQVGTYPGALSVGADAAFYGGFDAQWQRGPVTPGGPNVALQGTSAAMGSLGTQAFAVYAASGVSVLFADIVAVAPAASGTANGNGRDSYAFYVDQGATLQLLRSRIVQGDGAGGDGGLAGVDAVQATILTPLPGGDANQNSVFCDNTSHGAGAQPSANSCSSGRATVIGGKGGDGGTMDTNCTCCSYDFTATAGSAGTDASYVVSSFGKGGGGGSGGGTCGSSQNGSPGVVTDGTGGLGGTGSLLSGGLWVADGGAAGSLGDNGSGGGGGGGSGGCDNGTDSYGGGGGGGGAGGCAAKAPGSGGGGGGASFGVFANSATVTATGNTFVLANGGSGGDGGRAGIGQAGGKGGAGGAQAPNGSAPGKGGDGGRGGVAGGGGGGQGGSAFGIYSYASTVTQSGNAFFGGVAGTGGSGGTSSAGTGAGQKGGDGLVAGVGSCVTPASCN